MLFNEGGKELFKMKIPAKKQGFNKNYKRL
jgi:hypothetical protein